MNPAERAKLNVTVLRRHDPYIIDICDQSPHAVVYKFMTDSWVKMSIEGVLFLVHRRTSPEYALIILNRNNMENFCLYLSDITDISLNDDFVICITSDDETLSLWLFDEDDRQRFVDRIQQLRKTTSSKVVDISKSFEGVSISTHPPSQHAAENQQEKLIQLLGLDPNQLVKRVMETNKRVTSHHNQHDPSPGPVSSGGVHPPPPPTSGASAYNPHPHPPPMEEMGRDNADFHSNPIMLHQQHPNSMIRPAHPQPPPPTVPDNEIAKPYFPASPQKTATLLQVLQGGMPPPRTLPSAARDTPQMMGQLPWPAWPSQATYAPPLGTAPPLTPQQALELTHPELDRRLPAGSRPILSKPEFIQQFLNMVQNDPTFLDTLYNQHRNGQIMGAGGAVAASASASAPLAPAKNMAPYYHQ